MRSERYNEYLEERDDTIPSGRYTEQLTQDGLSPLAKVGIGVGVLGLAVLGIRSAPGQRLLASVGRGLSDATMATDLEQDIVHKIYASRSLERNIKTEMVRSKVYQALSDSERYASIIPQLQSAERDLAGFGLLTRAGTENFEEVIRGFSLENAHGVTHNDLIKVIGDAAYLNAKERQQAREIFKSHMSKMNEALKDRYLVKDPAKTNIFGLRKLTVDDVLSERIDFGLHDPEEIITALGARKSQRGWSQRRLQHLVGQDESIKNLWMGRGLYVGKDNQLVDLRMLHQIGGKALDSMKEVEIPVVGFNMYKVLRIEEFKEGLRGPLFQTFYQGELQPALSSIDRKWALDSTIIKHGDKLYDILYPDRGPVAEGYYSVPGSRNIFSRIYTKVIGEELRGARTSQPSVFTKIKSKFIDDSTLKLQPETLLSGYTTAESSDALQGIHKVYTYYINKGIDPLDEDLFDKILKDNVEKIYGQSIDLGKRSDLLNLEDKKGSEKILKAFDLIANQKTVNAVPLSEEHGKALRQMWYQYNKDPLSFAGSQYKVSRVKLLLQKEFARQSEINIQGFDFLKEIERASKSPFATRSKINAKNIVYSQILEGTSPEDISRILLEDSEAGKTFRKLSRDILAYKNPFYKLDSGLVRNYPENELLGRSPRLLVKAAELNPLKADFYRQLVAGRHDPQNITAATAISFQTGIRINEMLSSVGLGLKNKDLGSAPQIFKNLLLKRYLPAVAGIQALRYLSYETKKVTGKSLEEVGADTIAQMQVDLATVRDSIGLTERFKRWALITPGLEMLRELPGGTFFDPTMTAEEHKEWLVRGSEARRKGRWWIYGNTPYQGGKVEYYEPSWYRRAYAQPIMTDVMYGSEDDYWKNTWMPTPRYPMAPIRHFVTDPYYYERKHYEDRPYLETGGFSELREVPLIGPLLDKVARLIFKPEQKMHQEYWEDQHASKLNEESRVYALEEDTGPYKKHQWGPVKVGAHRARRLAKDGKPVVVAVIDSGVDPNHPDLEGVVYPGINVIKNNKDAMDDLGHGTHVAGTIAARGLEGQGLTGVARDVRILPIKVLNSFGFGTNEDINKGIQAAIDWVGPDGEKVEVINMSLGSDSEYGDPVQGELIQKARESGISIVSASGNAALSQVGWPARWADNIAVGAIDADESLAPFSNYGPGQDFVAPGVNIFSTVSSQRRGFLKKNKLYDEYSGTSMASPHVAGVVAFIKSQYPDLTPDEIRYLMQETAKDLGEEEYDELFGHGLVQVDKAIEKRKSIDYKELIKGSNEVSKSISKERQEQLNEVRQSIRDNALIHGYAQFEDSFGRKIKSGHSAEIIAKETYEHAVTLAGLYGFMMDATLPERLIKINPELVTASSTYMTSGRRQFYDSGINGLGIGDSLIDFNEVARRFIGKPEKPHLMYNPVKNTMPDWMPGDNYFIDFQSGDPYIKITRGEERLPGAGYEALSKLHPDELGQYGKFDRFKILADVAPYSEEYKAYSSMLSKDPNLSPELRAEATKIRRQVSQMKKRRRFFPYKFKYAKLDKEEVTVTEVIDANNFLTEEYPDTPIRFAGLHVGINNEEAKEFLDQYIYPGAKVTIGYSYDPLKKHGGDKYNSIRSVVYATKKKGWGRKHVTNINRALIEKGHAREKERDFSHAAIHARFTPKEIEWGKRWEEFAHKDTMLHTKFLQVRSPLESYKRRDLYGKDWQPWKVKDILVPTLESIASSNVLKASVTGAVLGYGFFGKSNWRLATFVGGAAGASLSILRNINENIKKERWIPKRRRTEREIDEYFDKLEYIKYKGLYESARRRLQKEDGQDIEELYRKEYRLKRQFKKLSKESLDYKEDLERINNQIKEVSEERQRLEETETGRLAAEFRDKYKSTLYGLDIRGDYSRLFRALPKKDRDYISHFLKANPEEREEILELVPKNQRAIYQRAWGLEEDKEESLYSFFKRHYLPSAEWEGWLPDKDIKDIKVKVAQRSGVDVTEFGFWDDDVLTAEQNQAPYIEIKNPNMRGEELKRNLETILTGEGLDDIIVEVSPTNIPGVAINVDIEKNREMEIEEYIENNGLAHIFY